MVNVGIADISIYDGLIMLMMTMLPLALIVYRDTIEFVKFDLLVLLWLLLNCLVLLNDLSAFAPGLNLFRNKVAVPISLYFLIRIIGSTPGFMNKLCWVFTISSAIMGIMGIYEFTQTHERIQSTIKGPHAAGVIFSGGLFFGYFLWIKNKGQFKGILALFFSICSGLGAFLTFGRVLIPAIILYSIITGYFFKNKIGLIKPAMICLLILATLAPFGVVNYKEGTKALNTIKKESVNAKGMDRLEDLDQLKAGAGVRTPAYTLVIKYIGKSPIWGHGFSIYHFFRKKNLIRLSHAHNLMLDLLLRSGIIGWTFYFFLIGTFISQVTHSFDLTSQEGQMYIIISTSLIFISLTNSIGNNIANMSSASAYWLYIALAVNATTIEPFCIKSDNCSPVSLS